MPYKDQKIAAEYRRNYYKNRRRTDPVFRESERKWSRDWRAKRPEWVRSSNKRAVEKARTKILARSGYILSRAKIRAKDKGIECSVTREWIMERIVGKCQVSGIDFDLGPGRRPATPSLDIIDSSKGYTEDNCRLIALVLNVAFSDWGELAVTPILEAFLNKKRVPDAHS